MRTYVEETICYRARIHGNVPRIFCLPGANFYNYIAKSGIGNTPALLKKRNTRFFCLGYGGPGHDGPYLYDSMMVAPVDLEKNTVSLIPPS